MEFENIVIRLDDFEVPLEQPRLIEYDSNQHDPCYRNITVSGCVDLRKMRRVKTVVSCEDLVQVLKEYFDKILTTTDKE